MSEVQAAIQEMFQAPHIQVSQLSTKNLANYDQSMSSNSMGIQVFLLSQYRSSM